MSNKEIKERVNNQIELANEIIELLDSDGHDHDIRVIDLLDEMASAGIELVPLKDINVASIAYLSLIQDRVSIDEIIKSFKGQK